MQAFFESKPVVGATQQIIDRVGLIASARENPECFVDGHPVHVSVKKRVGLGLAVYRVVDTAQRDVGFAGPAFGLEQHCAAAVRAKPPSCAVGRLIPAQVMIPRDQPEMIAFKAYPGDVTGAVSFSAHAAVAVRTPFAGQLNLKMNSAAQAAAVDHWIIAHGFLLNSSGCKRPV